MTGFAASRGRAQALRGHAAMLGFSAAVSGSFSLGAMVANDISPVALTAVRFLLASLVLALLVSVVPGGGRDGQRGFTRDDWRAPWRYALMAALYTGYFVLMFEGLKTAQPVSAGAVFTLTPLMTAAVAWPFLGQRLRPVVGTALGVGAVGALWVIFRGDTAALLGFEVGQGEAIYFLGCILHAVYAPMLRRLNRGESALVTASMITGAGFFVLLAYGWRDLLATDWATLPALVWVTLAYLVVFATAFSATALQFAAQRLPVSKVMAYTYATPCWIILWELALGHGGPGLLVLPGVALIVVALLILLRAD
ncbi:DMT family transporter [Pararhodobacter zhoushanensis]|uniref:DMT family transporter n=1 Tax=Pararhodobacter zhoushanensis TaxID=2479545 RepID=UPI000F8DF506|nr:DMT family transporter [Pararhodobacter zhoushanensis]